MTARAPGSRIVPLIVSAIVPTMLAAAAWVVLVEWRPTTTWHLAPALVAGAGAWVTAQGSSATTSSARWWIGAAAVFGFVVAWGEVGLLQADGRLAGPALFGGDVVVESIVTAALSSALAAYFGIRRGIRLRADEAEVRRGSG